MPFASLLHRGPSSIQSAAAKQNPGMRTCVAGRRGVESGKPGIRLRDLSLGPRASPVISHPIHLHEAVLEAEPRP